MIFAINLFSDFIKAFKQFDDLVPIDRFVIQTTDRQIAVHPITEIPILFIIDIFVQISFAFKTIAIN